MILALRSEVLPQSRLYDVADSILAQKLSQVDGVGQVNVGGGARPAVRIELNPTVLADYGLGLEDLRDGARPSRTPTSPRAELPTAACGWTIADNDQLFDARSLSHVRRRIPQWAPGAPGDIADVQDSVEDLHTAGLENAKPSVLIIINRQPGANIVGTADRIRAMLPSVQASIPASVEFGGRHDRTITIRASVADIQITLLITVLLVICVIFVFLRIVWATVIPAVAVPVSLIGTFGVNVFARLFDRQSFADGANDLDGFRGGRCYRRDRKHNALSRSGTFADAGRASRVPGNRIYGPVHELVTDRGLHSHSADGWNRRKAVP